MTEQNRYLQVHVIEECYHEFHRKFKCVDCGAQFNEVNWIDNSLIDFSTPTHYEALRKQLVKLGEWENIHAFILVQYRLPEDDEITFAEWEASELVCRVELIYEYAKSKGPEYWKEKRG